jgi:hypothetical protein
MPAGGSTEDMHMIVQPTLLIPPAIEVGLISGALFRNGSVVRVADTGRIFKLLDEIPNSVGQERGAQAVAQLAKKLKDPRVVVAALVVGTVAVVGITVWKKRDHEVAEAKVDDTPAVPECVHRYNASLAAYIEAIRDARLSLELLDRVLADLDAVKDYEDPDGGIVLDFSTEHAAALLNIVADFTRQLAEANDIDLAEAPQDSPGSEPSVINSLRRYLEVQRRIFTDAA